MQQYTGPVIMFLIIVLLTIIYMKSSNYNKRLPLISAQATVLKKWDEQWKNSPNAAVVKDYYVEFDIDGQAVKVMVTKRREFAKIKFVKEI